MKDPRSKCQSRLGRTRRSTGTSGWFKSKVPWCRTGANGGFRQRCVSSMKHSVTVAALAKPSAVVLTALAAIVMTDYLKCRMAYPDPETLCSHYQNQKVSSRGTATIAVHSSTTTWRLSE